MNVYNTESNPTPVVRLFWYTSVVAALVAAAVFNVNPITVAIGLLFCGVGSIMVELFDLTWKQLRSDYYEAKHEAEGYAPCKQDCGWMVNVDEESCPNCEGNEHPYPKGWRFAETSVN